MSPAARRSFLLATLLILGFVLRLTGLTVHSFWADEGETVATALSARPFQALEGIRHPPLSFLAFRAWIQAFGESDAALRLLPALLSCLSLGLFARLATLWLRDPERLVAVALYAVSAFHVWHGQEVRGYAFLEIGTLAALLGTALVLAHRTLSASRLILVFAGTVMALGAHYLGALVGASVGGLALLAWGFGRLSRSRALALLAATIAGIAVWIPWLVAVVPVQMDAPFGYQAHLDASSLLELPARQLLTNLGALPGPARPAVYALGAVLLCGFVLHLVRWAMAFRRQTSRWPEETWIVVTFVGPVVGALLLALVMPPNITPKYLMAASPGSVLMMGSGLGWLGRRGIGRAAVAVACLGVLAVTVYLKSDNFREDFRSACRDVESRWQIGDPLLVVTGTPDAFNEATVRHYFRGRPAIRAAMVRASDFFAGERHLGPGPYRLHVIYRRAPYAWPYLKALDEHHHLVHQGESWVRVHHAVYERRP